MEQRLYIDTVDRLAAVVSSERHKRGLTQAELAKRAGVAPQFIVDVEHGRARTQLEGAEPRSVHTQSEGRERGNTHTKSDNAEPKHASERLGELEKVLAVLAALEITALALPSPPLEPRTQPLQPLDLEAHLRSYSER